MSEITLKIPADQVEAFRANVYSEFAGEGDTLDKKAGTLAFPGGESWSKFIGDDDEQNVRDNIERYAVDVLKATRNIAALVEVLEQLGWTDPINGEVSIAAERDLLDRVVSGVLTDIGVELNDLTESRPFEREAFISTTERGKWLADLHREIGNDKAKAEAS